MPSTVQDKLFGHDFYTNSVQACVEDDDIEQFLHDHPDEASKLLVAVNALEVTYGQVKEAAEAHAESLEEPEDDEPAEDEDEE